MSQKELKRLDVIKSIQSKRLSQIQAAKQLGVGTRQIRRLLRRYQVQGEAGLISGRRGKASNNKLPQSLKQEAISLIRARYHDFGPTFAHEKLTEVHQLKLSVETLRQWMISEQIWQGKQRKVAHIHQSRDPRPCEGELIQIDGSPHAWFEDRAPKCTLLVFVDDATSKIMQLHFEPQESTQGYFDATYQYVLQHGLPACFYSDRHGIFKINQHADTCENELTQFGRAMDSLGIEPICANSPQAKGRVENKNGTLQDRLVKELRLKGISDMATANAYLPEFIADYNQRFAKTPANKHNAHVKYQGNKQTLRNILSHQEERTMTKNLEVHYCNHIYQIQVAKPSYNMRGAKVLVIDNQGQITLVYKDRTLPYKVMPKRRRQVKVASSKEVNLLVDQKLAV